MAQIPAIEFVIFFIVVGIIGLWIAMLASRCCAPCCCQEAATATNALGMALAFILPCYAQSDCNFDCTFVILQLNSNTLYPGSTIRLRV